MDPYAAGSAGVLEQFQDAVHQLAAQRDPRPANDAAASHNVVVSQLERRAAGFQAGVAPLASHMPTCVFAATALAAHEGAFALAASGGDGTQELRVVREHDVAHAIQEPNRCRRAVPGHVEPSDERADVVEGHTHLAIPVSPESELGFR